MATNPLVLGLLGLLVVLFALLTLVLWQLRRAVADRDPAADDGLDADRISAALSRSLRDAEFGERLGQLESHAREMRDLHGDIEAMLTTPQERGEFGEVQLDVILGDHLPPEMYGVRERVVDGKTPDAHVRTSSGVVCIDSKFPLENFARAREAEGEVADRAAAQFRDDVAGHLEKIATDYVRPEAGTARFAFAFIPSEAVYYHLVTEERDLLREYTARGVQAVSPLTLGQKLELVRADVHAQRLSEEAEAVQRDLQELASAFDALSDEWSTLHRHVTNAQNKADDVDRRYEALRQEFQRVEAPTVDPSED